MTPTETAPRFFIAVAVILLFCRAVSWLLGKASQPPVVSEMLAGVLLGPSLLGLFFPAVQDALFPDQLLPILYVVGQVGLVLFMFQAGYAFAAHKVTQLAGTAGAVSLAGVIVPLVLGVLLVLVTARAVPIQADGTALGVSAAFVGVALAITAGAGLLDLGLHDAVRPDGTRVPLSSREFELLRVLAARPNAVHPRSELRNQVFDKAVAASIVDTYVYYVRRKLGRPVISTVHGLGYRLGLL